MVQLQRKNDDHNVLDGIDNVQQYELTGVGQDSGITDIVVQQVVGFNRHNVSTDIVIQQILLICLYIVFHPEVIPFINKLITKCHLILVI